VQREVFVSATKPSNEVVLESVNGTFSNIAAVGMRWDKLEINTFVGHVFFDQGRAFIVKTL
jgi:hypothetical protein